MKFPCRCKDCTDRYHAANYPVSCRAMLGQQRKFSEFRGYLSPWYRVCTNARFILKGTTGVENPKMQFPSLCKIFTDRYVSANYLVSCSAILGQQMEIFGISGLPIAMAPCLHQCKVYIKRKLRVWRALKCNFLIGAKTAPTCTGQQTTPCHTAPYYTRKWKILEFLGYISPWYRVCTNAVFIFKGSYGCGEPKNAIC